MGWSWKIESVAIEYNLQIMIEYGLSNISVLQHQQCGMAGQDDSVCLCWAFYCSRTSGITRSPLTAGAFLLAILSRPSTDIARAHRVPHFLESMLVA